MMKKIFILLLVLVFVFNSIIVFAVEQGEELYFKARKAYYNSEIEK